MNQTLSNKLTGVKRKHCDENQVEANKPVMEEAKRANFSALANTNGLPKTSPHPKPDKGKAKKINIKTAKRLPTSTCTTCCLPDNFQVCLILETSFSVLKM